MRPANEGKLSDAPAFGDLVKSELGQPLPADLERLFDYQATTPGVQAFTLRALKLMELAEFEVADLTTHLLGQLSKMIPGFLPSERGGQIPPLTMVGRHQHLDKLVAAQPWQKPGRFLDVACGFPPVTTIDTANALAGWSITGLDRSFAHYHLVCDNGDYATYDRELKLLHCQTGNPKSFRTMADNWSGFLERMNREFHTLLPSLPDDDATSPSTVKGDRFRLTRRPIQGLASEQLSFRECDIFSDALGQAEVVRAMNILIYFDQSTQQILLRRLGDAVMEAGMLLVGTNGGNGCEERYTCYRREPKLLVPEYFSFSLDNLRPLGVMPWFTLHEDDLEARRLARYASLLRSDLSFWREFSAFFDDELARRKMMVRDEAGNLRSPNGSAFIDGYHAKMAGIRAALEKEFTSKAIDALQRQGVEAFRNEAGHLAVPAYVADGLKPLVITD